MVTFGSAVLVVDVLEELLVEVEVVVTVGFLVLVVLLVVSVVEVVELVVVAVVVLVTFSWRRSNSLSSSEVHTY